MKHRSGEYRWFHTYGTIFDRNSNGKVEHVLNITLDVTEQIFATEKIKEQEHFIQQIADASPTILYLFDVESQGMVYINREIFFFFRLFARRNSSVQEFGDKGIVSSRRHSASSMSHTEPENFSAGRLHDPV